MNRKQANASYILAFLFFIALSMAAAFFTYLDQKNIHDHLINTDLQRGVESLSAVLPPDLHDRALASEPFPLGEEKELAFLLGELAHSHSLAYLYTLIKTPEGVRFVTSSPSEEEIAGNDYELVYLTSYEEMNDALLPMFDMREDQYLDYQDRWGEFRSIFRPVKTPEGNTFLLGGDIDIEYVNAAIRDSVIRTLLGFLSLILVCLPLLVLIHVLRRRELKAQIRNLYTDELTGLGNKQMLRRDLGRASQANLLLINILRFRDINGALGPAVGDMVLQHFAWHLAKYESDLASFSFYRLYGDEFAVMFTGEYSRPNVEDILNSLIRHSGGFEYKAESNQLLRIEIAIGASINQQTDRITLAQLALESAQERHHSWVIFDQALAKKTHFQENLDQLKTLRHALDQQQLVPWFQPIFDAKTMEIDRYEVLARIVDEQGNVISMPHRFIPVAHRYQLYSRITREILRITLQWLKTNDAHVSLNLSISDIEQAHTREFLFRTIRQSGCAQRLSFELLESEAIHDVEEVRRFFHKLRRLGCHLGIDDLGKEYSNFDRIMALPLDFIKLDGSVIKLLEKDEESFDMVGNIVQLARKRGLSVTAEMVSNNAQLEIARSLGCDLVQGYYLAEPLNELADSVEFIKASPAL